MKNIIIYTRTECPYSLEAKKLLKMLNIKFDEYQLDHNNPKYTQLKEQIFTRFKHRSFPVILTEDSLIGGYAELIRLYNEKKLFSILS